MIEMRQQKRNPYHWVIQALETSSFFCVIYRLVKSNKFGSHGIVLVVFMPTKKLAQIGRQTESLWPFYVTALVFVCYTLGGKENFVGMWMENPCGLDHVH